MAAVDGEAARGRRWLDEYLFPVSLAGDSVSWLQLHVEGVSVVRFPDMAMMVARGGRRPGAEQRVRVRQTIEREADEEERTRDRIRPTPALAAVTTSGDRCLCALHHEPSHHAVSGPVARGTGAVIGERGQNPLGH
jgi:hypothetical protein